MKYTKEIHDKIIKKSHQRSLLYGIEKERIESRKILNGEEISFNIERNKDFIGIAATFINNLYDFVRGSGYFIILTDKDGCILYIVGDSDVLKCAENLNMVVGAYMDESSIGTNAMGTAIKENIPIQISAREHFIRAYHKWTCSAAPIHNSEGEIIGTLNLTGYSSRVHPHTLGLVVASVQSIENQLNMEKIQKELFQSYIYMNSIMNSISYGILAVDTNGIIRNCNLASCKMLNLTEEKIMNISIDNILRNWKNIFQHLKKGDSYESEEVNLKNRSKCSLSAYPIKSEKEELIGVVLIMNEIQNVLNLVNKYTGKSSRYTFNDLIYKCDVMKKIVEYSKDISDSPSTVLIQGESGTGKEVLAQAIHNYSKRKNKPFVAINCGAIPKNLIESELFGYEEGAFTGAKRGGRPGKFELANGGTLFLDEIGEMPLDMQVNLLRVLQEGYINRVGGSRYIPVDVRIIAATNKNLIKEIEKGTFRDDLYYRLSVIPIELPSLRVRKEDIKPLIEHFLKIKSSKLNKPIPEISDEFYNRILNYNWRGNIRELENFIENVVNFGGKTTFQIINNDIRANQVVNDMNINVKDNTDDIYICSLEGLEKKAIKACLKKFNHNISKASKVLGVSRNTLYLKIKKYKIDL